MKISGFNYDSPVDFRPRQRWMLRLVPPAVAAASRVLYGLNRVEVRGGDHFYPLLQSGRRVLLGVWHETALLAANFHAGHDFHTLTSYSYDGEMAARILSHFGIESIRGSSSVGGNAALSGMEKVLKHISGLGITLDGPRGPRRVAKRGIAILAARTRLPIIPQAFVASVSWRTRSWDRFCVPKPFGRIVCSFGEPIPPPENTGNETLEKTRLQVETALNQLYNDIESELGIAP